MDSILDRLLNYYHLSREEFAQYQEKPSFSSIPLLHGLPGVEEAKKRLLLAKERNEKALIFGDYDTDGVMSASIMARLLRTLGIRFACYMPTRYTDGYGISMEFCQNLIHKGIKLVILVDNGITLVDEVVFLKSHGIDVIIIDHHEYGPLLPPISEIVHPIYSKYGDIPVSAGYLCFLFSVECIGYDEYLLTLGALSTISDMMPIKKHNREIVRLMLEILNDHPFPEITLALPSQVYDEKNIAMGLIPQINAVGRLDTDHHLVRLVHYFADPYRKEKVEIANWMKEVNEARKQMTSAAFEKYTVDPSLPAIIVMGDAPEGLNGLIANKFLYQYKRPIAVFSTSKKDKNLYVGSIRSLKGFEFNDAQAALEPYLFRSGGHAHAGGMTVRKEVYPEFRKAFLSFAAAHPCVEEEVQRIPLYLNEANMDTYELIRALSPFGQDFKEPQFELKGFPLDKMLFNQKGCLCTYIDEGVTLFSFNITRAQLDARCTKADLGITFAINVYRGKTTLNLYAEILKQY